MKQKHSPRSVGADLACPFCEAPAGDQAKVPAGMEDVQPVFAHIRPIPVLWEVCWCLACKRVYEMATSSLSSEVKYRAARGRGIMREHPFPRQGETE